MGQSLKELAAQIDPAMDNLELFAPGIKVPDLRPIYLEAVMKLDEEKRIKLITRCPQEEFCDTAIDIYSRVGSWRKAERILEHVILPLASMLTFDHVGRICDIVVQNIDVRTANGSPSLLSQLFAKTYAKNAAVASQWLRLLEELKQNGPIYYSFNQAIVSTGLLQPDPPNEENSHA